MSKRKYINDEKILTTGLKKEIKWTRPRIFIVALVFFAIYGSFVFYTTSISMVLAGIVIAAPVILATFYGLIYFLNRDLF